MAGRSDRPLAPGRVVTATIRSEIPDAGAANPQRDTGRPRGKLLTVLAANVFGGAEVQTHALLSGLCAQFEVTLLTHARIAGRFAGLPLTLIEFERFGLDSPYYYGWRNVQAYGRAIARVARDRRAEIVYAVMHNSSLFVAAARWSHPWLMRRRALIGSLHGSFVGCFQQRGAPPTRVETAAIRAVVKTMGAIVTPSRGVADELIEVFGARPDRVHPIYNGFDLEAIRASADRPLPIPKNTRWIVTCCRLSEQKDFRTLIGAFSLIARRTEARLVIVGDGPERPAVEALIREHGLNGQVTLAGFQANPFPWIRAADVFVLSSFYEGFGNVIIEAFALGVPVIASDCPWGPSEIIEPDVHGYLFTPGDVAALASYLDRLLSDEALRFRLAEQALTRSAGFSLERMVAGYAARFATSRQVR